MLYDFFVYLCCLSTVVASRFNYLPVIPVQVYSLLLIMDPVYGCLIDILSNFLCDYLINGLTCGGIKLNTVV